VTDGKAIIIKKNWQVASEDPLAHAKVAKGSTVELGVKHLTDETPTPTPTQTPTPTPVPAKVVAPVVPPVVKAPPAVAPPVVKAPPTVVAPPVYSGIICKDGYAWPGTTRRGACHGHGGI